MLEFAGSYGSIPKHCRVENQQINHLPFMLTISLLIIVCGIIIVTTISATLLRIYKSLTTPLYLTKPEYIKMLAKESKATIQNIEHLLQIDPKLLQTNLKNENISRPHMK